MAGRRSRTGPSAPTASQLLRRRLSMLERELAEARATLAAIREGEVEAVVVAGPTGTRVYTLEGTEHQYRVLVEEMQEGAATLGPDGAVLFANRRLAELLGLTVTGLVGLNIRDVVPPEEHPRLESLLTRSRERGTRGELTLWTRAGQLVPVLLAASVVSLDGQEATCLIVTSLGEQKRVEAELRRTNRALRIRSAASEAVTAAAGETELLEGICRVIVEVGGHRLAWAGLLGDPDEPLRPVARAGHDEGYLDHLTAALSGDPAGRSWPIITALTTGAPSLVGDVATDPGLAPGREAALRRGFRSIAAVPMLQEGRVVGVVSVYAGEPGAFDTEEIGLLIYLARIAGRGVEILRGRAERERSAEALRAILESITDGFFTLDRAERFTYINGRAEELMRRPRAELLGRGIWDVFPEALDSAFGREYRRAMAEQVAVTVEDVHPPLGIWFEARAYPSPDGLSVYLRDTTERRRTEQRVRQAEKLTTLGSLVSGVAHELNNPLTVVTGYARILENASDVPEAVKRRLEKLAVQARRASKIVKNLLTFARQQPPQMRRVHPAGLIDQALDLLAYHLRVSDVQVVKSFAADTPDITADPDQLLQVFLNIAQNAAQALQRQPERRLTVSMAPQESRVQIVFDDSGPGIPPEVLPLIFDPFFTTKPSGQGTGLGLAICYGIVKGHGGDIFAESAPGSGARFVIELPVGDPQASAPEGEADTPAGPRPRRARILAIDDEPEILHLMSDLLAVLDQDVETTGSARTALERIEAGSRYDVILLDVRMPEMDGRTFYEELASRFPEAAARVVFTTGDVISVDTRDFLEETGRPSLAKPFSLGDLERAVARVLTVTPDP